LILHAGLIARFDPPNWRGVLIDGASGAGKSDLALRAIESGWTLVADDRTLIWTCDERLFGRSPDALTGLIEARGVGVIPGSSRPFAQITLIVGCVEAETVDRFPDEVSETWLGCDTPRINLAALEPSALSKLNRALTHLGLAPQPAYHTDRARVPSARRGRGPLRVQA
jgi:serine kinase of HPr protein (carbohydrate metabolism regulator)